MKPLSSKSVKELVESDKNIFLLDCRNAKDYQKNHISGSIFVPLESQFAIWTAYIIDPRRGDKLILITEPGKESEAIMRLARTGIDCCIGYLDGGFDKWLADGMPTEKSNIVTYDSSEEFLKKTADGDIIDVRNLGEWNDGVLAKASL